MVRMPACHAGGQGFEPPPGRHKPLLSLLAGVAQLAEQLICNQQVAGSSPITSSNNIIHLFVDGFPSGQREQTVNLPSQTSMVRIHPHPPFFCSAGMAELADAHGSGPCVGDNMQVQVLFPAPWRVFLQHLKSCEDTRFFLLKQRVCRRSCSSRTRLFWC